MSALATLIDEGKPPKPTWSVDDIPDLAGKIVIVTGGNAGVGKETVKALLNHNAKVYLAARSAEKAQQAINEFYEATGKYAIFLKLDLANLHSTAKSVEEFLSKENQLHILFNNAGVMSCPVEDTTSDGYDLQFGTNVLGHFYFTRLLLPTLLASVRNSPGGKVRVVMTSSSMHYMGSLEFNTFKDGPARRKFSTSKLYSQSKFGNVVVATELARRYGDQGIVSISVNPGNLRTDLQRHMGRVERYITLCRPESLFVAHIHDIPNAEPHPLPRPYWSSNPIMGGTSPEGADFNGKYLKPWARIGKALPATQDPELGKRLWDWLEAQIQNL